MSLSLSEAARAMGMPEVEILDVAEHADGVAVQTHDGRWSLVAGGAFVRLLDRSEEPSAEPAPVPEEMPEPAEEPEPVKAPARRKRAG